jgi:4-hydroxybenzoate polyprenyltransferase/predicted HAD superfamily phosphohydrolase YqeG
MRAHHFFRDLPTETITGKIIFLDIDGTLVPEGERDVDTQALEILKKLQQNNIVYLCTNGKNAERNTTIEQVLGINIINGGIKKPSKKILRALPQPVEKPLVVIGDKFLTDGIFAKRLRAEFIKVKRLHGKHDPVSVKAAYVLDDISAFIEPYLMLIRPWQWIKNLLVAAPLFFAGSAFNVQALFATLIAAIAFCLVSSATYVLNDIYDRDQDRLHPTKKYRPLASGLIGIGEAKILFTILLVLSFICILLIPQVIPLMALYIALTTMYSAGLKRIAVLDLVCVAFFYVLRVIVGGVASHIHISPWIVLCVLFGAFFVIVGKRRSEFRRDNRRAVLEAYSQEALDYMLVASLSLAIMTYGIWSVIDHESTYLVYSTLFVVFALFRMLNRIYIHPHEAESPEILVFKDSFIFAAFILWVGYVFFIIYPVL